MNHTDSPRSPSPDGTARPSKQRKLDPPNNATLQCYKIQAKLLRTERNQLSRQLQQSNRTIQHLQKDLRILRTETDDAIIKLQENSETSKRDLQKTNAQLENDLKMARKDAQEKIEKLQKDLEMSKRERQTSMAAMRKDLERLIEHISEEPRAQTAADSKISQPKDIIEQQSTLLMSDSIRNTPLNKTVIAVPRRTHDILNKVVPMDKSSVADDVSSDSTSTSDDDTDEEWDLKNSTVAQEQHKPRADGLQPCSERTKIVPREARIFGMSI